MTRESAAGAQGTESPDGEREWTQDQHITTLLKMTRTEAGPLQRGSKGGLNQRGLV